MQLRLEGKTDKVYYVPTLANGLFCLGMPELPAKPGEW